MVCIHGVNATRDHGQAARLDDPGKAEVSSAEGDPGVTSLWIDTKSRRVLRILSTRPTGTITAELQP